MTSGGRTPKRARARVTRVLRDANGAVACTVLIPCDHPTHAVELTDQDGNLFQVDCAVVYGTGLGRTVVRRQEPDGTWTRRLNSRLEPIGSAHEAPAYARPAELRGLVERTWARKEREAAGAGRPPNDRRGKLFG